MSEEEGEKESIFIITPETRRTWNLSMPLGSPRGRLQRYKRKTRKLGNHRYGRVEKNEDRKNVDFA